LETGIRDYSWIAKGGFAGVAASSTGRRSIARYLIEGNEGYEEKLKIMGMIWGAYFLEQKGAFFSEERDTAIGVENAELMKRSETPNYERTLSHLMRKREGINIISNCHKRYFPHVVGFL